VTSDPVTSDPVTSTADVSSQLDLLDRSRHSLLMACQSSDTTTRHQHAQLAALRAAASMLATRRHPRRASLRTDVTGPHSLWQLVPSLAPELAEWAGFFEMVTARSGPVSAREADDLLRQAEIFLDLVCRHLGLPAQGQAQADVLVPTVPCLVQGVGSGGAPDAHP
jgi:hypothetical protein